MNLQQIDYQYPENNDTKCITGDLFRCFEGFKFQEVVESVVHEVRKLLNAETVAVALYDIQKQELVMQKPAVGIENIEAISQYRVPINGQGMGIDVFRTGNPYMTNNPYADSLVSQHYTNIFATRTLISIPLEHNSRRIGILLVGNKRTGDFNQEDLNLLIIVSSHLTLLIENAVHYELERKQAEELTKSYHELANKQQQLQRLMDIHRKLVTNILNGEGLPAIIETLAQLVNRPVVVEDKHLNVICSAKGDLNLEHQEINSTMFLKSIKNTKVMQYHLSQKLSNLKIITIPAFPDEGIYYQRVMIPLADKHSILGYLSVIFGERVLDEFEKIAVEQAALIASLEFVKEKNVVELETKLRGELINDIIYGTNQDHERIISRARYFAYNLCAPQSVAVLRLDTHKDSTQRIHEQANCIVNKIMKQSIIADKGEDILILTPQINQENGDYYKQLKQISYEIEQKLKNTKVKIGIGEFVNELSKIRESYLQANRVLEIMDKFGLSEKLINYNSLGIFNILFCVNDSKLVSNFVNERLGPLLRYDKKNNSDLVASLECYLKKASIKEAAEDLFVHVRTMKYRLNKVEEILNVSLSPEVCLALNIAIKLNKILNQNDLETNLMK